MSRIGIVSRVTQETSIDLSVQLDQAGPWQVDTNLPILTHFLSALALHSRFGLVIRAEGDVEVDAHHLVEDVGIALGQALTEALADRRGIARYGQQLLPMDDALVLIGLDISGRGQCYWSGAFPDGAIGLVAAEVWPEFFHGLARSAGITLHMRWISGANAHHVYEACFKGLGRALAQSVAVVGETVPSTKGSL